MGNRNFGDELENLDDFFERRGIEGSEGTEDGTEVGTFGAGNSANGNERDVAETGGNTYAKSRTDEGTGSGEFRPLEAEESIPAKKRRGRPPGSGSKGTGAKAVPLALAAGERVKQRTGQLLILHLAMSGLLKAPEMQLQEPEAKALATSIVEIENLYNVQVSPKVQAWLTFVGVSASIYGPKVMAVKRRAAEAKPKMTRQAAPVVPGANSFSETVVPMHPAGMGPIRYDS